ncbi:hypothetical protein NQ317_013002 [Molorchus minor]|uniref:DUF3105 domain-containing protein n=1 Tax=Molorchus minor TaxID=1323400 RepID=A0ABQ9K2G8_9CUCU|nr:hypothetical protein NQ317_013002 [Molorchus minor]
MLRTIVLLCIPVFNTEGLPYNNENWNGKWFPHSPNEPDSNPQVPVSNKNHHLFDAHHGIVMGVKDPDCDDGEYNLKMDWYLNPENYTCYEDRKQYLPKSTVHPIHSFDHIPAEYNAPHRCMNESIEYSETIPTFGTHRPLWAIYGEYKFLPRQRWLHNLEHGAVAMLYHPCANTDEVNSLRKLVKGCLYRYVITPYSFLSSERPLALVTWGHRLEMSKVAPEVVIDFIRKHAIKGPEMTHKDGQYDLELKTRAEVVSTPDDSNLCPNNVNISMK